MSTEIADYQNNKLHTIRGHPFMTSTRRGKGGQGSGGRM